MGSPLKASNEQIIDAYKATGSVWAAAKRLGMGGQSVWERLRALGIELPSRKWSAEEVAELRDLIGSCTLTDIANRLGRPYAGVALMASRMGIVTRFGNRIKRKVPRGAGLTKPIVGQLLRDLEGWDGALRQFCRSRGLSIDVFAIAVQHYEPDRWRQIAWHRGLEEKECPECGVTFYPMTGKQITCTRRCGANHRRNKAYFGGRRQEAIGLREGVCQLCQKHRTSGLQAHHMLGKENDPDNHHLIALCPGCHKLVGLAATRKVLDTTDGWQRLAELVLARRLADQDGKFVGTHVSVDVEYLTEEDLFDLSELKETA